MTITQVFPFEDGETILVGSVDGATGVIKVGRFALHAGASLLRDVEVEMTPKASDGQPRERSVPAAASLGLPSGAPSSKLTLVSLAGP